MQGSDEWLNIRSGKFTSSRVYVLMQRGRNSTFSVQGLNYIWEKAIERKTKIPKYSIQAKSLEHGLYWEPFARKEYEKRFHRRVILTWFRQYNDFIGASGDGLIGINGGLEIKCPRDPVVHEQRLDWKDESDFFSSPDTKKKGYMWQVDACMLVFDRRWWDFMSFHPHFPEEEKIVRVRVYRNKVREKELLDRLFLAEKEVQKILEHGRKRHKKAPY